MPPLLALSTLLAPLMLWLCAMWPTPPSSRRPTGMLWASRLATVGALLLAVLVSIVTAVRGATSSELVGVHGVGLSVRLDAVSCSMFVLVALVGVIVVQYSRNYMDGDARHGAFMARLCLTLAAVMLLVLAGNLVQLVFAWIATSLSLHRLLVFYRDRRAARLAARKKFIAARLGDACLIGAAAVLVHAFGSTDLATILGRARLIAPGTAPFALQLAAGLTGIAALLKSAQFPSHGWLPEVVDTPTPVSALLHAGIINAGGFLMIRLADVMLLSAPVQHAIALIGGFTALFGGVVMLTQTSVKQSLAWSTVAQMGFMTLQCGLGVYAIALLHLLAHSLYKAHAFLTSGSLSQEASVTPSGKPRVIPVLTGLVLACLVYAAVGLLCGAFRHDGAAVLTLGAILVIGIGTLIAPTLQGARDAGLVGRMLVAAGATTGIYFAVEAGMRHLTAGVLPPIPVAGAFGLSIMVLAVLSFAAVAVLQSLAPRWMHLPQWRAARVHLSNGLYCNAWFNRLAGVLLRSAPAAASDRAA